jgi:hypothetical protein
LRLAEASGNAREIALAHLLRGEELLRAHEWNAAGREFESARASGAGDEQWTALFGIALESGARDTAQLFRWFERGAGPALASVQARLPEGSGLVEFWIADGRMAALWITRAGSGVADRAWNAGDETQARAGRPVQLDGLPWQSFRRVAIVPDGALHLAAFELLPLGTGLLIERMPVSYLPSASLLVRERPSRTTLPPWRAWSRQVQRKTDLQSGAPVLHVSAPATVDLTDANRSRIRFRELLFRPEAQALSLESVDLVTLPVCDIDPGRAPRRENVQSVTETRILYFTYLAQVRNFARVTAPRTADKVCSEGQVATGHENLQ